MTESLWGNSTPAFSKAVWILAKVGCDAFVLPVSMLPIVVGATFDSSASVICDQPRRRRAALICSGVITWQDHTAGALASTLMTPSRTERSEIAPQHFSRPFGAKSVSCDPKPFVRDDRWPR